MEKPSIPNTFAMPKNLDLEALHGFHAFYVATCLEQGAPEPTMVDSIRRLISLGLKVGRLPQPIWNALDKATDAEGPAAAGDLLQHILADALDKAGVEP